MPAPKDPRYWNLKQPRLVHFYLATLVAQGITSRAELAQAVGLSPQQVSRITNSPLFADMVAAECLHQAEAAARAARTPADRLAQESISAINQLAMIRDFSGKDALRLNAAARLLHMAGF
jgi:hypothetical protein